MSHKKCCKTSLRMQSGARSQGHNPFPRKPGLCFIPCWACLHELLRLWAAPFFLLDTPVALHYPQLRRGGYPLGNGGIEFSGIRLRRDNGVAVGTLRSACQ